MDKKHDDRRKKQRPQQDGGFEIQDLSGGILRFPSTPPQFDPVPPNKPDMPPPRFGAEQVLRELHEALEGHEFSSKEELDAFIGAFNQRSMKPSAKRKASGNPKHEAQDLAYQAMETRDPIQSARLCDKAIKLDPHCVDALMHLTRLSCEDGDDGLSNSPKVLTNTLALMP